MGANLLPPQKTYMKQISKKREPKKKHVRPLFDTDNDKNKKE